MQKNSFFYKLLSHHYVYFLSQKIMSGISFREKIARLYIKKQNINILDIGCGPAEILASLNNVNYFGYDINSNYINYAKKKYLSKKPKLYCKKFTISEVKKLPKFDVVLLFGLIHHLNNQENKNLISLCKKVLKKGGFVLTEDPILIKKQNFIARKLVELDRGANVRTEINYIKLLKSNFKVVKSKIYHQSFIPYTWFVTRCSN